MAKLNNTFINLFIILSIIYLIRYAYILYLIILGDCNYKRTLFCTKIDCKDGTKYESCGFKN